MVENGSELLLALARSLPGLVEPELLQIDRQRSVRDRMSGRDGEVVRVRLAGPELTLTLAAGSARGRPAAEAAHVVRGVVISRRSVPVAEWLDLLAGQLHVLAAASATDDAAVTRTLAGLGVREPGSDLVVDPSDVPAGLRALPARLTGRVPADVLTVVERICTLLLETVPRVEDPEQAHAVLRTATDYLPRTLREYTALPPDWAQGHRLEHGGTALDALREQLAVLEAGVSRMREAAISADAAGLLANGTFLTDRFGLSDLDLPDH